jgi:septal ring factor EnvC (AmiA/AmiB activator)
MFTTLPTDLSAEGRIRDLERDLAKANHLIELYKHEQKENTNLIAMYEDGMGTATEQIRNYCGDIEGRFLAQRRHYNNLLQQEKDEHLESRLDRDHWHAQTLRVCEMIRTAYRLRTDEWGEEYPIISGLQSEVRCYRRVLGMEAEKPEEETGWPYLKDLPLNDQN